MTTLSPKMARALLAFQRQSVLDWQLAPTIASCTIRGLERRGLVASDFHSTECWYRGMRRGGPDQAWRAVVTTLGLRAIDQLRASGRLRATDVDAFGFCACGAVLHAYTVGRNHARYPMRYLACPTHDRIGKWVPASDLAPELSSWADPLKPIRLTA